MHVCCTGGVGLEPTTATSRKATACLPYKIWPGLPPVWHTAFGVRFKGVLHSVQQNGRTLFRLTFDQVRSRVLTI